MGLNMGLGLAPLQIDMEPKALPFVEQPPFGAFWGSIL